MSLQKTAQANLKKPDLKAQLAEKQQRDLENCKNEINVVLQKHECEMRFSLTIDNKGNMNPAMWVDNK